VLARQLGVSRGAALVAGAAFAFSPFRLSQAGHLQILSSGGIPLALAMLARGHAVGGSVVGAGAARRPGWALAGWLVAVWQLSLGFGLGLMLAYLLGALTALTGVVALVRRVRPPTRLLVADAVGLGAFVLTGRPARAALPAGRRGPPELPARRRDRRDLLAAGLRAGDRPEASVLYGEATRARREAQLVPPEMALLPGVAVAGLALLGLLWPAGRGAAGSGWPARSSSSRCSPSGPRRPSAGGSPTWCCSSTSPAGRACARPGAW
jgi:hypothetical protein